MATKRVGIVFKEIHQEIDKSMFYFLQRIAAIGEKKMKEAVVDTRAEASSALYNSIEGIVDRYLNGYMVHIVAGVPYADFVDEGTKPHFPPVNAIAKWLRYKKGSLFFDARVNRRAQSIAFLIARSISRKGIKGKKFVELGIKRMMPLIEQEINAL